MGMTREKKDSEQRKKKDTLKNDCDCRACVVFDQNYKAKRKTGTIDLKMGDKQLLRCIYILHMWFLTPLDVKRLSFTFTFFFSSFLLSFLFLRRFQRGLMARSYALTSISPAILFFFLFVSSAWYNGKKKKKREKQRQSRPKQQQQQHNLLLLFFFFFVSISCYQRGRERAREATRDKSKKPIVTAREEEWRKKKWKELCAGGESKKNSKTTTTETKCSRERESESSSTQWRWTKRSWRLKDVLNTTGDAHSREREREWERRERSLREKQKKEVTYDTVVVGEKTQNIRVNRLLFFFFFIFSVPLHSSGII